jgi:O-antigen ligase
MFSVDYLREGSTSYRKDLLSDTIAIASEHLLTGIGYGQLGPMLYNDPRSPYIQDVADQIDLDSPEIHNAGAHNLLLEVWVEYGLLGLVPYIAFLALLLRDLNRLSRSPDPMVSDLATAVMAGVVAFLVCGAFGHLKLLKVFWLLAGVAACLRCCGTRLDKESPPAAPASAAATVYAD